MFEVFRHATAADRQALRARFRTMRFLESPTTLWSDATALGQRCRDQGITVGGFDLLIATVALHHRIELVTFDSDYALLARVETSLRVRVLDRVK